MLRIYLVRHGQVEWNSAHAYAGQTDLPLDKTGREQAESLARYFAQKDISAIYSSDLSRARETAEIIASKKELVVQQVPALREVNYGKWEGLTETDIAVQYPEIFPEWRLHAADVRIPGGETFDDVKTRAFPAFKAIAGSHANENIIIVAHKSVNRVLLCCLLGVDINRYRCIAQENACINTIQVRDENWMIVENINERCHLTEKCCTETGVNICSTCNS